jgi:hypothetical protein
MAKKKKWIQAADDRMSEKGTKGSFGKATKKKIARAKKQGGKMEKKAIFAENMKRISRHNRRGRGKTRS